MSHPAPLSPHEHRGLASDTFKPYGSDSSFGKKVCYQCHTLVKERDYIFTNYPLR